MAGGLPEGEFDFGQPFEVDLGRAAVLAEGLRESGFPLCTADVVMVEGKPCAKVGRSHRPNPRLERVG